MEKLILFSKVCDGMWKGLLWISQRLVAELSKVCL